MLHILLLVQGVVYLFLFNTKLLYVHILLYVLFLYGSWEWERTNCVRMNSRCMCMSNHRYLLPPARHSFVIDSSMGVHFLWRKHRLEMKDLPVHFLLDVPSAYVRMHSYILVTHVTCMTQVWASVNNGCSNKFVSNILIIFFKVQ